MVRRSIVACVVGALFTSALVSASAPAPVGLAIDGDGTIRVNVSINGQGPFVFLLDTGSNRSSVTSDLAARLALPVVAKAMAVTPAGREEQLVVALDRLTIGSAGCTALLASVIPSAQLTRTIAGVDGIVGQDFLSRFNYTLDYRKRLLRWTADDETDDPNVRLPLTKTEGRFLVELPQEHGTVSLVPDSGAQIVVLFTHEDAVPLPVVEAARHEQLVSLTIGDARLAVLRRLQVGRVTMKNQSALLVRRDEADRPAGDGLLPLQDFGSVSFNCAEGYMVARK